MVTLVSPTMEPTTRSSVVRMLMLSPVILARTSNVGTRNTSPDVTCRFADRVTLTTCTLSAVMAACTQASHKCAVRQREAGRAKTPGMQRTGSMRVGVDP